MPLRTRPSSPLLLLALAALALGAVAGPASADQLGDKRAEAARLARQLEAQGRKVSVLAEDLDEARLEAGRLAGELSVAQAQVEETDRQMRVVRDRLRRQGVAAYVHGGQLSGVELLSGSGGADDLAVRRTYLSSLAGQEQDAIGELQDAREARDERRAELEVARRSAAQVLAKVDASRRAAAQAASAQRATLARVSGELTALVEAEARRRAAEEARRARAEVAARQARAEAARRARAAALPKVPPPPAGPPRPPAADPPRAPAGGAEAAVAEARRQLGKPYEYGADGPGSFDCSGLTMWAWRAGGRSLPHSSRAQFEATSRVPLDDVRLGDLLFYGRPIHHVGIYVGDATMVEASETGTPVRYASIYRRDMVGVGRVGG